MSAAADTVRAFADAFNSGDLDALTSTLTPDIEVQSSRGLVEGHDEVRRWAARNPSGYLHQRLVLDDVSEQGTHAVATIRRQWYWRHSGQVADEQELFYVATLRDGLICRWQPFENRDQALQAAGVGTSA
ncbi:MAG TPA: nuclear transport factor 2 family protein [Solirubrobacterales bacterium]|jgi:ketosteroid isomerase-like protein|nr:nuclear transport factor 2 family protein [Solirubrobacterales bacterium]